MPWHHAHASRTARRGVTSAYTRHHDALSCGSLCPAPWDRISDPVEGAGHVSGVGPIFGKPGIRGDLRAPRPGAGALQNLRNFFSARLCRSGRIPNSDRNSFFRRLLIRDVPSWRRTVDVRLDRYGVDATSGAGEPDHPAPRVPTITTSSHSEPPPPSLLGAGSIRVSASALQRSRCSRRSRTCSLITSSIFHNAHHGRQCDSARGQMQECTAAE
jgi:hypothetical protein